MSNAQFFSYGVQGLFAGGPSPLSPNFESIATTYLEGIQSATITLSYPRSEFFGWDGGGNQELVERPTAQLNMSWIFTSGLNEGRVGFAISPGATASALSNLNTERNFYLLANQEGTDLAGYSGLNNKVMALGNGVLTHYDFNASVGQPTVVNAVIDALNLLIQPSGSGQILPSVYKQSGISPTGRYVLPFAANTITNYFEASPNNIRLTFDTGCAIGAALSGANSCPIQSFAFSIDLARQPVKDMGWAYPDTRPIHWPVNIGINANAYLNQIQVDALNRFGCPDSGLNFSVRFNNACGLDSDAFTFQFNGAKLDSQSFNSRIGAYTQASFSWSLKINDMARLTGPNFFMTQSGLAYSSIIFPEVDYVSGLNPLVINLGTSCYLSILSGPGVLIGNQVEVTDDPAVIIVRAATTDGADTQDITLTVS